MSTSILHFGHGQFRRDFGQWTPTITTYLNYDGQLGRQNYDSNGVTGGVRITF